MQSKTRYTATSRQRAWWQRARPQFWLLLALVLVVVLAGLFGLGKFMFRNNYPPLPVAQAAAARADGETATPNATATPAVSPTPDGDAPWASQMVPIDNSQADMTADQRAVYQYDLPDDARARLESDWKDIIDNFYSLPQFMWARRPDLVQTYTTARSGKMKAAPTGAPTGTAVPQGTTFEASIPGARSLTLYGCDVSGTTCLFVDVWTHLTVYRYDYYSGKVVGTRPGHGDVAYTVVLKWKDNRWKLHSVSGKPVQYVTAVPDPTHN